MDYYSYSARFLERKISIANVRTSAYNKDRWKHYSRKETFYMATKSANLYARIEPDVKENAESILSTLGISASSAINMFYKQIILQRGLPFEVKIPSTRPVDINTLSEVEFNEELEKGYADMQAGRTKNAKKAFADIRKDYGL
jgi:DNA-damage-inducible protein J